MISNRGRTPISLDPKPALWLLHFSRTLQASFPLRPPATTPAASRSACWPRTRGAVRCVFVPRRRTSQMRCAAVQVWLFNVTSNLDYPVDVMESSTTQIATRPRVLPWPPIPVQGADDAVTDSDSRSHGPPRRHLAAPLLTTTLPLCATVRPCVIRACCSR